MKLRISGNSVRIRLSQSEVKRLADGGRVEQATEFSVGSVFISSIESSGQLEAPRATFQDARLAVLLPAGQVIRWADSNDVGIEADQPIGDGRSLRILIEKDFECLHGAGTDNADSYPNPRK